MSIAGPPGSFWVGTWSGLLRLDSHTGRILEYYITYSNAGLDHHESVLRLDVGPIASLFRDRRGRLWIARFGGPLSVLDETDPERHFRHFPVLVADDDPHNDQVRCFLELDDRLFFGTNNGLVQYDRTNDTFRLLPLRLPAGDTSLAITSLARSGSGSLLAVANGLPVKISISDLSVAPLHDRAAGLVFSKIIEDRNGGIWVNSENGLTLIGPEPGRITYFDSRHYLQDNTFREGLYEIDQDTAGNLYFGGAKGFTVVDPQRMYYNAAAPKVKVTALKINNQPLARPAVLTGRKNLTLPYRQNSFSVEFAAMGSLIPELNTFAYRLNGGEWIELGTQNVVTLSNLGAGSYHLQVRAANSDGIASEQDAGLYIDIRPPWYRAAPALLLYVAALAYAIFLLYRFQLRRRLEHSETLRLKELDGFKSQFFTNITHEFRTPLTVILGSAEQLATEQRNTGQPPSSKLQLIKNNGESLLRLINQILDLAQLNTRTLKLNYVQGDLVAYLNYIAESLYSFANAGNVRIKVESSEREIVMDYEPEHLRQIVYNLLSNAIKFTSSGGKILLRIRTTGNGQWLQLFVEDTGVGIPAEDLPHIFDRFFRAKNQDVTTMKGSGVGLALTKQLVKAMGGDIEVQSPTLPDGRGTTFTLTLPITNEAPAVDPDRLARTESFFTIKPAAAVGPDEETGKPLLLIIEDNPDVLEYIISCVQADYQLHLAYNGRAGIEKAFETLPDIILSDIMMPEKSGLDVLATLKQDERTSHIPIVLLSAKATVEERVEGLSTGADAYLTKPFYPQELLVTLSKLVELRKVLQAKYAQWLADPAAASLAVASATPIEDAFLQKLRSLVEKNLSNAELDMPQLERSLAMSRSQIFRKVKALTGKSPTLFIRSVRLHHARQLLQTTELNISEVAYEVGFTSSQYFSHAFMEEFQVQPSKVRESGV